MLALAEVPRRLHLCSRRGTVADRAVLAVPSGCRSALPSRLASKGLAAATVFTTALECRSARVQVARVEESRSVAVPTAAGHQGALRAVLRRGSRPTPSRVPRRPIRVTRENRVSWRPSGWPRPRGPGAEAPSPCTRDSTCRPCFGCLSALDRSGVEVVAVLAVAGVPERPRDDSRRPIATSCPLPAESAEALLARAPSAPPSRHRGPATTLGVPKRSSCGVQTPTRSVRHLGMPKRPSRSELRCACSTPARAPKRSHPRLRVASVASRRAHQGVMPEHPALDRVDAPRLCPLAGMECVHPADSRSRTSRLGGWPRSRGAEAPLARGSRPSPSLSAAGDRRGVPLLRIAPMTSSITNSPLAGAEATCSRLASRRPRSLHPGCRSIVGCHE